MVFYVYILRSESSGRYYCGSTVDFKKRVREHNDPGNTLSLTTKRFKGPWILKWKEEHSSRKDAMLREKQIKKRGIRRFLDDYEGDGFVL